MNKVLRSYGWRFSGAAAALVLGSLALPVNANPTGGTVVQGTGSFTSQGSQFTIRTSDRAQINWSSFNIGVGETTSFIEPSSSSVVWNRINDPNASQLLGNLNANGYVVLQNSSGFYIGGQAVLSAHGLVLTTSPMAVPNMSSGGAWDFTSLPPTASIINYGQLRQPAGDRGGSVFLISSDIQNNGVISAPQGTVGLYAGRHVLVSSRPDGRGLSASVTLPQGSVDNEGQIIADAGTIAMHAQVVNQGGLVQANSMRNVNGVIELVASGNLNLGSASVISAQGDAASPTPSEGGFVVAQSGSSFADTATSTINVSGQAGGRNGVVEVFGSGVTKNTIQSQIDGQSAAGFQAAGGLLLVNPLNITLSRSASTPSAPSPNLNVSDLSSFSKIDLFASGNITLATSWSLATSQDPEALLSLSAGNNITLNNNSSLVAGNSWDFDLSAGPRGLTTRPAFGDSINLNGNSFIQTQNGSIDLWAANNLIVNPGFPYPGNSGAAGSDGIRTRSGGSIEVTAQLGDVNTGGNINGYIFGRPAPPYYRVSPNVGGISTIAGGDVTITAGRNVTSYLPVQSDYNNAQNDAGTGAFGPQPGNVTIHAGGDVSGHYVVANGVGTITAGGDIGAQTASGGFALSLVRGSWSVSAPHGSIFLQDVRNPSGVFNDHGGSVAVYSGYHLFDYDPRSSLTLAAGDSVEITGAGAPHDVPSSPGTAVPILFPPSLRISAGAGGIVLDTDVILFPSPYGEMHLDTSNGGDLRSYFDPTDPTTLYSFTLSMSDSAARHWSPNGNISIFGLNDHASTPPEINNRNPVEINIAGSVENVTLRTTKAAHVTVGGDMFNGSVLGENLHPGDVTYVHVTGRISYSPVYAFTQLTRPIVGADPLLPSAWDAIFSFLVDPSISLQLSPSVLLMTPAQQTAYAFSHVRLVLTDRTLQTGYDPQANPGFIYDPATRQLGFRYQMSTRVFSVLDHNQIPILRLDSLGNVVVERHADGKYYFGTTTASFIAPSIIEDLYRRSLRSVRDANSLAGGFQIGGPGLLDITAGSMDLGSSGGIISWGIGSSYNPINYSYLAPWTPSGAGVNVNVAGDITLLTSTIASVFGGDVTVHSSGGGIFLSQGDFALIPPGSSVAYGIWTSGNSDVAVVASRDIDVGGARIATFNGGNIFVRSEHGNVNAGNGANSLLVVPVIRFDPGTGLLVSDAIQNPRPFGSGIIAVSPTAEYRAFGAGGLPGNIDVETPQGDIVSTLGGIQQFALDGTVTGGPTITLTAGTAASGSSPGYVGNVDLGQGGVIGGTINITAQGSIEGLIVSRQNANINAAQSFTGTLLAGGTANVNASAGTISGTIIGIGGVNASGGAGVTAAVLGQNVSIGGATAQSTLGTTAAATSTSQAAAQQANSDTQQQLAKDTSQDDENKKKNPKSATLTKRVGRVTVILPPG